MTTSEKQLEQIVLTQLLRLNAAVQGVVTGVLAALVIFLATNWLILQGGPIGPDGEPVVGPHLSLLSHYFIGYRVTFLGSLVGAAYGLVVGFCIGYFVSRIYNLVVDFKEGRRQNPA